MPRRTDREDLSAVFILRVEQALEGDRATAPRERRVGRGRDECKRGGCCGGDRDGDGSFHLSSSSGLCEEAMGATAGPRRGGPSACLSASPDVQAGVERHDLDVRPTTRTVTVLFTD